MYLIVIAWIYVVLMMAVAEATNSSGSVLGAIVTFLLYGVGPAGLVAYLMGAPARNKRNKKRMADAELAYAQLKSAVPPSDAPNTSSHPAGGAETVSGDASVAPVRKET